MYKFLTITIHIASKFQLAVLFLLVATITGCGGGGSSSPSATQVPVIVSTNTFNFQSAWQKFNTLQYSKSLSVSGSCSGSMTYLHSAASQPMAFDYSDLSFPHPVGNVNPAYFVWNQQQIKTDLLGCAASASSTTTKVYFDATTFAPFGYIGGTAYNGATSYQSTFREFSTRVVLPSAIKVGDAGIVGSVMTYNISNFKKYGTPQGQTDVTYLVEADTSSTALVNIISKVYDANGKLTLVDQTRYQIDVGNNLTLSSIDQQYSDSLSLRIIAK
jgi:hypothetical protein